MSHATWNHFSQQKCALVQTLGSVWDQLQEAASSSPSLGTNPSQPLLPQHPADHGEE